MACKGGGSTGFLAQASLSLLVPVALTVNSFTSNTILSFLAFFALLGPAPRELWPFATLVGFETYLLSLPYCCAVAKTSSSTHCAAILWLLLSLLCFGAVAKTSSSIPCAAFLWLSLALAYSSCATAKTSF